MSAFDWVEDESDLRDDIVYRKFKTPAQIQDEMFNVVYKRDLFAYWNSIEWDSEWLNEKSLYERAIEDRKKKEQQEIETHPFRKFF